MSFTDNIFTAYKKGNTLIKLIYVNVSVFLLVNIFLIVLRLFNIDGSNLLNFLEVPSDLTTLLHRAWTPITYMFLHMSILHIFFNMLMLYWFGKIFLMYYSEKQLFAVYVMGGLFGALFYILGYNIFPIFEEVRKMGFLLGASGAIMAIVLASAVKAPNVEMQLILIGRVKLIYVALITVAISLFGVVGLNGGGELAHLGGAFAGYLFVVLEKSGKDITPFFNKIVDFFVNLFRFNKKGPKPPTYHSANMSDGDFNRRKAQKEQDIDKILDKIKTSGYESLTAEEKRKLFEQKK